MSQYQRFPETLNRFLKGDEALAQGLIDFNVQEERLSEEIGH
jgi:hypothetical protein